MTPHKKVSLVTVALAAFGFLMAEKILDVFWFSHIYKTPDSIALGKMQSKLNKVREVQKEELPDWKEQLDAIEGCACAKDLAEQMKVFDTQLKTMSEACNRFDLRAIYGHLQSIDERLLTVITACARINLKEGEVK